MNRNAEFDLIVHGATGYTGRLVAEYLGQRYGVGGEVSWGIAGRSLAKLQAVRDDLALPAETPLVVADAEHPAQLDAMVRRARAIVTTVGPYQLYGEPLVAACVAAGTDYLDLCGEPTWMAHIIDAYDAAAKASGAKIVHSCGFDSIPFELGVVFCEETAKARFGAYVSRVKGRVRAMRGGLSGGTAASGAATLAAIQKNPRLGSLMMNPFALTPGFEGPPQPHGNAGYDEDLSAEVGPFMMAVINTKNVHRANALLDHRWGTNFTYEEMAVMAHGAPADLAGLGPAAPQPGEGPSKAEREAGFYDLVFLGLAANGQKVRVCVKGDRDPGYGSTSKMLAEAAICLVRDTQDAPGGVWTPGALMGLKLLARLEANAGLAFTVEG